MCSSIPEHELKTARETQHSPDFGDTHAGIQLKSGVTVSKVGCNNI